MTTYFSSFIRPAIAILVTAVILSPAVTRADTVLDWNVIMQATVAAQPPFPQARYAAITQLAVFEAVNAITQEYRPYLGTINSAPGASAEAAAVAAAYTVLASYFPAKVPALESPSGHLFPCRKS